jgi:osmotically-inducible protein OsmY
MPMKLISRMAAVTALALALSGGACNRASDPTLVTETALKESNLGTVKVDWDKEAHVAHLKGTVDTVTERERAEQVATAAVGTSGKVLNEVTVKGLNEKNADDMDGQIKSTLKKMVNDDPTLKDRDISFEVNNGVVTVKGDVQTAAEKNKVAELVRSAPGVKDMANALEIKPKK